MHTTCKHLHPSSRAGFSLIELTVVLAIYGSIAAMALVAGNEWIKKERINTTRQTLQTMAMMLENYAKVNGRLPCPGQLNLMPASANYGLEAWEASETLGSNTCLDSSGSIVADDATNGVVFGAFPSITLGNNESLMRDQWGGLIVYYVTARATQEGSFWRNPKDNNYLEVDAPFTGAIQINDITGSVRTNEAMFALVSHGPDQHGAYGLSGNRLDHSNVTDEERENCDCDSDPTTVWGAIDNILVQSMVEANFDDLVYFELRQNFLTVPPK